MHTQYLPCNPTFDGRAPGRVCDGQTFHYGEVAGFASYNEVQPATRVSVVVLSNLGTTDATGIGRDLESMGLG